MKRLASILFAGCVTLVSACSSSAPIDAAGMESAFIEGMGGQPIKSMCDPGFTHWACFYDGVQAGSGYLEVDLSTPGGMDEDELAMQTGSHWFNFIHCQYPELKTIVVTINGIDHNVFRSDTRADSISC